MNVNLVPAQQSTMHAAPLPDTSNKQTVDQSTYT